MAAVAIGGHPLGDGLNHGNAPISTATIPPLEILEAADVPSAPILRRRDVMHHPQIIANETVKEYQHPDAGLLRQARPPAQFSGTPPEITRGAPRLGEFTEDAMRSLGYDEDTIAKLAADGVIGGGTNKQAAE